MGESNFHRLERARCPSARGQASTRFPIKTDSLDQAGGLPPITYLSFKLQRGQLKQPDRRHVQTDADVLGEAG